MELPLLFYISGFFFQTTLAGVVGPVDIGPFLTEQECLQARAYEIRRGRIGEAGLCRLAWEERGNA
jgi:hypothetical protein